MGLSKKVPSKGEYHLLTKENTVIGFIGTGVMGKSMAMNLIKEGYPVYVYSRTKEKANDLIENGAVWADSPKAIASQANVIITIIGYPKDVEEVYLGEDGLIPNGKENTYLIDMTTSTPSLAIKLYDLAKEKNIHVLDAPVSGGDIGARDAKLSIMVGGDQADFEAVLPILSVLGTNIVYQGKAGSGQHTKMCNQIVIASNMIGISEAVVYAIKSGLDPENVLKSITSGAAGSWGLSNLAPKMIHEDLEPGFYIKHLIKDINIAIEEAGKMGMETPGLSLSKSLYNKLAENGLENKGTQALFKYWEL